jgi:hypothetical protein
MDSSSEWSGPFERYAKWLPQKPSEKMELLEVRMKLNHYQSPTFCPEYTADSNGHQYGHLKQGLKNLHRSIDNSDLSEL